MAISGIETIEYSLVLVGVNLLTTRDELVDFFTKMDTEMTMSVDSETNPNQREIQIPKDQIKIITTLADPRTNIHMGYPDSKQKVDRFAEIAFLSISCSRDLSQLRALGYNVSLAYGQNSSPSAHEYLSRLFNQPIHPRWNLHGGSCTLEFRESDRSEDREVNLVLEPRGKDRTAIKVYANLNFHRGGTCELPTREEIKSNVERAENAVSEIIHLIDKGRQ